MTPKDAFKLGFAAVLAEHGVSPQDLVLAADHATKIAAAQFVGSAAPLIGGMSVVLPLGVGHAAGGIAENLLSQELEDPDELRKRFLIHRLQGLVNSAKAKRNNQFITEALKS